MGNKFQLILSDPPWSFSDSLTMSDVKRSAVSNYNIMSVSDICALPVKELADPDGCLLALWVPSSLLKDGLRVMQAWGFELKQTYIWVKVKKEPLCNLNDIIKSHKPLIDDIKLYMNNIIDLISNLKLETILSFGMGRLFRQTHEICLIGINNTGIYKSLKNKSQRSVCFSSNKKHSQKPEDLQDSLDLMFPEVLNKFEMFARRERTGWVCVGNECPSSLGEDINDSMKKLL